MKWPRKRTTPSVEATSEEAQALLTQQDAPTRSPNHPQEWDDVDAEPTVCFVEQVEDDDWDTWDEDEPITPTYLSKKERKLLERQEKDRRRREEKAKKAMKKLWQSMSPVQKAPKLTFQ